MNELVSKLSKKLFNVKLENNIMILPKEIKDIILKYYIKDSVYLKLNKDLREKYLKKYWFYSCNNKDYLINKENMSFQYIFNKILFYTRIILDNNYFKILNKNKTKHLSVVNNDIDVNMKKYDNFQYSVNVYKNKRFSKYEIITFYMIFHPNIITFDEDEDLEMIGYIDCMNNIFYVPFKKLNSCKYPLYLF